MFSIALPDSPKFARYVPTYFMTRQILFVAISFVAALVTVQVPVSFWEKASPWIFVASRAWASSSIDGQNARRPWRWAQGCACDRPGLDKRPGRSAAAISRR